MLKNNVYLRNFKKDVYRVKVLTNFILHVIIFNHLKVLVYHKKYEVSTMMYLMSLCHVLITSTDISNGHIL